MNNSVFDDKRILEALDLIDDKYIAEVTAKYEVLHPENGYVSNKRRLYKAYAVALARVACILLLSALVCILPNYLKNMLPFIPSGVVTEETSDETEYTCPELTEEPEDPTKFKAISNEVIYCSSYYNDWFEFTIDNKDRDTILSILNRSEWNEGLLDGIPEYIFEDDDETTDYRIEYTSHNGVFWYRTYFTYISEADRLAVNAILNTEVEKIDFPPSVTIKHLVKAGDAVGINDSYKSIIGNKQALDLIAEIEKFKETNKSADAIPLNPIYDTYPDTYSAEIGTSWITYGKKIYRISPDRTEVALVDGYLGAGKIVSVSESFLSMLDTVINYYPYDYDIATYKISAGEWSIHSAYEGESAIKLELKGIDTKNKTVTVSVLPAKDYSSAYTRLEYRGENNLFYSYDTQKMPLFKGKEELVTLSFADSKTENETIYIIADQSFIEIRFEP